MKRTFNFTGKKKIPHKNIQINIKRRGDVFESFDAEINLERMSLPKDAPVYVEAYHRAAWSRYDFGKVGDIGARQGTDLGSLGHYGSLTFRVLVTDDSGKILALAKRVRPTREIMHDPLLPVALEDIGRLIWRVDYGMEERPVLVVNEKIPGIENIASRDSSFILYVYPAVLREILNRIIFAEDEAIRPDDLTVKWHDDWIKFARMVYPEGSPPKVMNPEDADFDRDPTLDWIDDVVSEFAELRDDKWRKYIKQVNGGV